MVNRTRGKNGNELVIWRCEKCKAYKTVKDNSFFSLFRKQICIILTLIKYWCVQLPIASAKDMLILDKDKNNGIECCEPIIGKAYKYLRCICSRSMMDKKIKLGGHNKDVEIDESLVAKVIKSQF